MVSSEEDRARVDQKDGVISWHASKPVFGEVLGRVQVDEDAVVFERDAKDALGIRREQIADAPITFQRSQGRKERPRPEHRISSTIAR